MGTVGVFFGTGFEEVEALTVVDILRRADIVVSMISVHSTVEVQGGHGITVMMDQILELVSFDDLDAIILPGGLLGTQNLAASKLLLEKVKEFNQQKKWIGAICAAPSILGELLILQNRNACVYPGLEDKLVGAKVSENQVEVSDHIITSRGLGTAIAFSLKIVELIKGNEIRSKLEKAIIY